MFEMRSVGINEMTLKLLGVEISDKKIPMMTPQFNGIYSMTTKTAPAMSEEAYEEAIRNQAKKDFEAGKCGGENNTAYRALKNSYVSVASPDRKGYIAKSFQQVPMNKRNQISYMQIKDASGQEIANYSPNTGWTGVMTKDEMKRESKFMAIYMDTWRSLKAEAQQQVKPTSSSIDTFI